MAAGASAVLEDRICGGVVVSPAPATVGVLESIEGGHPLPTADSERAGRRALEIAASTAADETLLVLLSGGASALMAVPAEGLDLETKRQTTDRLLLQGADIHALNAVRKHLSAIKGGWLAARTAAASVTFAVSDVMDDDLSVIGSGPAVPDDTTFAAALAVLNRFGGARSYPPSVVAHLDAGIAGAIPETPKTGDPRLARATAAVVGSRRDAMAGAAREADARGYCVARLDAPVVGESRAAAVSHIADVIAQARDPGRAVCVISSGETTVRVAGHGKGGRNQEFALALAAPLAALGANAAAASVGTDGIDGPTDAAGAIVDCTTVERARAAGVGAPSRYLDDNNAYAFFHALGDLVHTGLTGTNVGDLHVFLLA